MFDKRINYSKGIIDPKIIDKNPYEVFLKWIKEAINSNLIEEPNAMNIDIMIYAINTLFFGSIN